jgi:signal transduction histidine kinase/ABC-type sulfate/molybdate transport systems ATPase subunit
MVDYAQATTPLLRVSGLGVSFGSVRALDDLELEVGAGELVALTGEPGAGTTTLLRCVAGDIAPAGGEILLAGEPVQPDLRVADRRGIAVVWQDLALCDNLDVAANVLLGQESRRLIRSNWRFHAAAASLLESLQIPIQDTTRLAGSLSGAQRQLVAMAKAISRKPRLLLLDEPTAALGTVEGAQVEELIARRHRQGTTILLVSRDPEQIFRMADRIVVLRHGTVVGELDPRAAHPDDLAALQSGQQVDSSARRQLTRLHGLADRLVSADPSSSLSLILSALAAALGTEKVCIHVVRGRTLVRAASLGFAAEQIASWARLPIGARGGPPGRAAARGERVVEEDLASHDAWPQLVESATIASAWSIPVTGPAGVSAVITVFRPDAGAPRQDELDLLTLYAGYAASAVERDRLLDQVTARNRVLETIREMLQTLAGPVTIVDGLPLALQSLRRGLRANEVALLTGRAGEDACWRAYAGPLGTDSSVASSELREASLDALADPDRDGSAREIGASTSARILAAPFHGPAGPTTLIATWSELRVTEEESALIADAAHSLRLALEREEAGLAHQETAALRRSRTLQREFLSRLSHELRTPLTAIRGYASSLMQPDVTWDGESQQRFLDRIAAESARLGRLVDDLLDFSAIESGVMRFQQDWCDISLVVQAAVSCLPSSQAAGVAVRCDRELPAVWADHDRLEQVFLNLLNNAFRHNPLGTRVTVVARNLPVPGAEETSNGAPAAQVEISVIDDGPGFPRELARAPFDSARRHRSNSAGAGLGLSIARGIVEAHGGAIELVSTAGTVFRICLPVEGTAGAQPAADSHSPADTGDVPILVGGGDTAVASMIRSVTDA